MYGLTCTYQDQTHRKSTMGFSAVGFIELHAITNFDVILMNAASLNNFVILAWNLIANFKAFKIPILA